MQYGVSFPLGAFERIRVDAPREDARAVQTQANRPAGRFLALRHRSHRCRLEDRLETQDPEPACGHLTDQGSLAVVVANRVLRMQQHDDPEKTSDAGEHRPVVLVFQPSERRLGQLVAALDRLPVRVLAARTIAEARDLLASAIAQAAVIDLEAESGPTDDGVTLTEEHGIPAVIVSDLLPAEVEFLCYRRPIHSFLSWPPTDEELRLSVIGALARTPEVRSAVVQPTLRAGRPPGVRMRAQIVRAARSRLGLTREELADKAELGDATIARAERGEPVAPKTALRIAKALAIELDVALAR